jgi:UDP-N-acetyl-D-mannosaminuronic acid dehydrogenase
LRPDLKIARRGEEGNAAADQVCVAHCPERVLPGRVLHELVNNDRVIGGIDSASAEMAREFYELFVTGQILLTDARTAELCKLAENSYRDVNIAFANELSIICERLEIDVWDLIKLTNCHPRVNILQPGPGVGGHCIAIDPWFIVHSAPEESRLIHMARMVNDSKPDHVIQKIKQKAAAFKNPVIACLGLAFKADIDDLRESPAIYIVQQLIKDRVGEILVVEPYCKKLPKSLSDMPVQLLDTKTAISKADIVVILANHRQFTRIPRNFLQ